MDEEKELPYPKEAMLQNVDYQKLEDDWFDSYIVDLEFQTMRNLSDFTEQLKQILLDKKMILLPELIVAHLCAYLGIFTVVSLGFEKALNLYPDIAELLKKQAHYACDEFSKYPVNSTVPNQEIKKKNLGVMRELEPSSIVVQTVRLGRVVYDTMQELELNKDISYIYPGKKQTELFCPQDQFIKLLGKIIPKTIKEWKERPAFRTMLLYPVNQATIQLGWLMGYFAHLDAVAPTAYLEYGAPTVKLYIESGDKFLVYLKLKPQVLARICPPHLG